MPFQPGVSGNPGGRPKNGPKRRVTVELLGKTDGKNDALDLLEAVVRSDQMVLSARMTAASMVLPYRHGKAGRFVERPLDIPESTCVADSKRAIAKLAAMARNKEISLDAANDLIAQESKFLEAEIGGNLEADMEELKATVQRLEASNAAAPAMVVVGGLPPLNGTSIDMPQLRSPDPGPADGEP
jgi:hypothetical protein